MGANGRKPAALAKLLPTSFTRPSPARTHTAFTPAFWMAAASCASTVCPASHSSSPVTGEITFSSATRPARRALSASFLLNL